MAVMVTGGSGYIGSHVVRLLVERGDSVVIVDDLATGKAERVSGVPMVVLDLARSSSGESLDGVIRDYGVDRVIHFAGRKQVAESVERPAWYYDQNVGGLAILLQAMKRHSVRQLVFSSSASVYGNASGGLIAESDPQHPINPYGRTKLIGEWMIADSALSDQLAATSLRYFNVAGAEHPALGDTAILNLIPMVFDRLARGESPFIFGADYPTVDGTCVRDFIHVGDLARAHLLALDDLSNRASGHTVYNVGTGVGVSVRQIIDLALDRTGINIAPTIADRRPGDPAEVVADSARIHAELGWSSRYGVAEMVDSAWESWTHHSA